MSLTQQMAREFYALNKEEVQTRLNALKKWPSSREIDRVLSIKEAVRRLAKVELQELVFIGMVGIVEKDNQLYPVRILELMLGLRLDDAVAQAKDDMEFERSIKGDRTPLDEVGQWD